MTESTNRKIEYILLAVIFGSMIQSAFAGFQIDQYRTVLVFIGALILLVSCILIERFWVVIPVYIVAIAAFLLLRHKEILNGFQIISNKITDVINQNMDMNLYYYVSVDLSRSRIDSVIAVTFAFLCVGLVVGLCRRKSILLFMATGIVEMILLVLAPYAISYSFFIFIGAWIAYDGVKRHKWRYGLLVGCVLCLVAVPLYYYDSTHQLKETEVKTSMVRGVRQVLQGDEYMVSGGISNGQVGKIGAVSPTGASLFQVTGIKPQDIYLKSFASGMYQDGNWKIEDLDELSFQGENALSLPYLFPDLNLDYDMGVDNGFGEANELTIHNQSMGDIYFQVPYFSEGSLLDGQIKSDSYIKRDEETNTYSISYFPILDTDVLFDLDIDKRSQVKRRFDDVSIEGSYFKAMEEYYTFAIDNYMDVPDQLASMFQDRYPFLYEEAGIGQRINATKKFLKENYTYTYRPGLTPDGQDPIEYFLKDSKKGFCTQYSSAAVMLLRSQGIPSRYVEGYRIKKDQWKDKKVQVTDYDTHAWVEVFIEDVGWVPVEVTGTLDGETAYQQVTDREKKQPVVLVSKNVVIQNLFKVLGTILVVILLILLWRVLKVWQRKQRFHRYNNREKVLHYEKMMLDLDENIEDIFSNEMDHVIIDIIQKAKYSAYSISDDEVNTIARRWDIMYNRCSNVTKILRIFDKY